MYVKSDFFLMNVNENKLDHIMIKTIILITMIIKVFLIPLLGVSTLN